MSKAITPLGPLDSDTRKGEVASQRSGSDKRPIFTLSFDPPTEFGPYKIRKVNFFRDAEGLPTAMMESIRTRYDGSVKEETLPLREIANSPHDDTSIAFWAKLFRKVQEANAPAEALFLVARAGVRVGDSMNRYPVFNKRFNNSGTETRDIDWETVASFCGALPIRYRVDYIRHCITTAEKLFLTNGINQAVFIEFVYNLLKNWEYRGLKLNLMLDKVVTDAQTRSVSQDLFILFSTERSIRYYCTESLNADQRRTYLSWAIEECTRQLREEELWATAAASRGDAPITESTHDFLKMRILYQAALAELDRSTRTPQAKDKAEISPEALARIEGIFRSQQALWKMSSDFTLSDFVYVWNEFLKAGWVVPQSADELAKYNVRIEKIGGDWQLKPISKENIRKRRSAISPASASPHNPKSKTEQKVAAMIRNVKGRHHDS